MIDADAQRFLCTHALVEQDNDNDPIRIAFETYWAENKKVEKMSVQLKRSICLFSLVSHICCSFQR